MNLLVTGGAGFIGSHTVIELINAGHRPIIIDNFSNSEPFIIERLKKITGKKIISYDFDYGIKDKTREIIEKEKIDGVVHFAAFKQVGESVEVPLKYYSNNVSNLINLLALVQECLVKYFVFSSSCTVYGEPDSLPLTEDSPIKAPTSPYGSTKQMGENILRDTTRTSQQLRSISLRYFNPIGAHPSALIGELPIGVPANLVPFITQTAAGIRKSLTVHGNDYPTPDGTPIRDYIHVIDLARAHVGAIEYLIDKNPCFYDVFNIGTGQGSSVLEVINTFETVTGIKLNYSIGARRNGDTSAVYASVNKAHKQLGWKAKETLSSSLADAWRWQKSLGKV